MRNFSATRRFLSSWFRSRVFCAVDSLTKKMKAGGSRLTTAVFVFICYLFIAASHRPTDLQVRVKFVTVIWRIRIHTESGFGECCVCGVWEYCCYCNHFVMSGMWTLQRDRFKQHQSGSVLLLLSWSDWRTLLFTKWNYKRPWTHHGVGFFSQQLFRNSQRL